MKIEEWVDMVSSELVPMAHRYDVPVDSTRAQAFGVPCNLLTAVRWPCHDRDLLRDLLAATQRDAIARMTGKEPSA